MVRGITVYASELEISQRHHRLRTKHTSYGCDHAMYQFRLKQRAAYMLAMLPAMALFTQDIRASATEYIAAEKPAPAAFLDQDDDVAGATDVSDVRFIVNYEIFIL